MTPTLKMIITTLPKEFNVNDFAEKLLMNNLCVCIQIIPAITSYYVWNNRIEHDEEIQLHIKFLSKNLNKLESNIIDMHPYDTPEIIVIDLDHVSDGYQKWANSNYLKN
jgi:periplasmic divalent cation tolerance protein